MRLQREREELAAAGRRLAGNGLVIGRAGNLSIRAGDLVAATPTGGVLAELEPAMMAVVDLEGNLVDGDLAPTSELPLHLRVYGATPATSIAHAHASASTALSCTHDELPAVHYMILSLGGTIRVADYATFGSDELAANVVGALAGRSAALMANHGSVAYGTTVSEACDRLELLEWLSDLYGRCLALGTPRILSEADLEAVFLAALSKNYGRTRPLAQGGPPAP